MKKQLLFTLAILFASLSTSAQNIVTTTTDVQSFSLGTSPTLAYTTTNGDGSWNNGAVYAQFSGTPTSGDPATGSLDFSLQGAGSVDGILKFSYRLWVGNTAALTITVDGVSESFTLDGPTDPLYTNTAGATDLYTIPFAATLSFTSGVDKAVTLAITASDIGTGSLNRHRLYNVIVDKTTLSANKLDTKEFALYPNPTTNSFKLSATTGLNVENVQIFNITGQLVKTLKPTASYDISDLKSGLYLATINTESGSETIKLLKQ